MTFRNSAHRHLDLQQHLFFASALMQSCEMSNFLHRQKFEFKILPQKRVIRDGYVFATKHVNPGQCKWLLDWFAMNSFLAHHWHQWLMVIQWFTKKRKL